MVVHAYNNHLLPLLVSSVQYKQRYDAEQDSACKKQQAAYVSVHEPDAVEMYPYTPEDRNESKDQGGLPESHTPIVSSHAFCLHEVEKACSSILPFLKGFHPANDQSQPTRNRAAVDRSAGAPCVRPAWA